MISPRSFSRVTFSVSLVSSPVFIVYSFQGGTSELVLCVWLFWVSVSVLFSPSVCLDGVYLDLGS